MAALGVSTSTPPEGTLGCGFCGEQPELSRYARNPHEGASFGLKCVSKACSMRRVETQRCGDEESVRAAWNEGRA
jgi:hypothetical protein